MAINQFAKNHNLKILNLQPIFLSKFHLNLIITHVQPHNNLIYLFIEQMCQSRQHVILMTVHFFFFSKKIPITSN